MNSELVTPETLDELAEAHGAGVAGKTFSAMAKAWRETERQLAQTQTENSHLAAALARALDAAKSTETLAQATTNALASIQRPVAPTESVPA